jgi:protein-tyrosine phosphatase
VGEPPDARAREAAAAHGVRLGGKARQVERADLDRFDWVVAMDRENLTALEELGRGEPRATLALLRDYDTEEDGHDVPDPYYGGPDGFERVYRMILRSCRELLTHLESRGPAA